MGERRKTVLITGAARGIGEACARRFAARGDQVVLVGLEPERLAEVAEACGPDALAVEADVRDLVAMQAAVARGVEKFGGVDVVIANAGIGVLGPIATTDPALFKAMVEVNVLGTFHTIQAVVPSLRDSNGYLLAVASLAAATRTPGFGGYSATKAAVETLAATTRLEVAADGVDVGIAYFGFLDTDLVREATVNRGFEAMRATLPAFLRKTEAVEAAVDKVVAAVDGRRDTVCYPRGVATVSRLRTRIWKLDQRKAMRGAPEVVAAFAAEDAAIPTGSSASERTQQLV
jgi:NAD(P)-dependent dehydrogenase (short-subunit alcohol dehydrogenase family)